MCVCVCERENDVVRQVSQLKSFSPPLSDTEEEMEAWISAIQGIAFSAAAISGLQPIVCADVTTEGSEASVDVAHQHTR